MGTKEAMEEMKGFKEFYWGLSRTKCSMLAVWIRAKLDIRREIHMDGFLTSVFFRAGKEPLEKGWQEARLLNLPFLLSRLPLQPTLPCKAGVVLSLC